MSEEKQSPEYELAAKKVDAIIGFKVHFIVYLAVNALLLIVNLALFKTTAVTPEGKEISLPFIAYLWVMWPICGWGIGIIIHYLVVRKFTSPPGVSWREAQMQKFMSEAQKKE